MKHLMRGGGVRWTRHHLLVGKNPRSLAVMVSMPRYVWCYAKCLMREGESLLDEALPAGGKTCGDGVRAQVCMALCEVFNERRESAR